MQSVNYGRADTAMPGFASQLSTADISAVVDYVRKAFMGDTQFPSEMHNVDASAGMDARLPDGLVGNATRGKAFYLANCETCHGAEGDGKGPRAYFILPKPRNFRHTASRHRLNRPLLVVQHPQRNHRLPRHNDQHQILPLILQIRRPRLGPDPRRRSATHHP